KAVQRGLVRATSLRRPVQRAPVLLDRRRSVIDSGLEVTLGPAHAEQQIRRIREQVLQLCERIDLQSCRTDRKSTRLNSSHVSTSYAVFCLKKNKQTGPKGKLNK